MVSNLVLGLWSWVGEVASTWATLFQNSSSVGSEIRGTFNCVPELKLNTVNIVASMKVKVRE